MRVPPTLQTIADLAGVSKNTVSCALRNNRRISEATRRRIHEIADEVGYRPNPFISAHMQNLRRLYPVSKTANLAFLHAFEGEEEWRQLDYCRELFLGAEERAGSLGFSLDPVWLGEPGMSARRLTRVLFSRGVHGIIVGPLPAGRVTLDVEWEHFAAAGMGFSLVHPVLHRAGTYQFHSIAIALRELKKLGYTRVGAILSPQADAKVDYAWTAGLAAATEIKPKGALLKVLRLPRANSPAFKLWLKKTKPDVVLSAGVSDVEDALKQLGLRVPKDIGVVSLSGETPTATVRRNWYAIGESCIDLVIGQLNRNERGLPARPKTVLLEGEWVAGQTVMRVAE